MEYLLFIPISLFIAWIWIDYFRLIDIFEKEKLGTMILTFLLGAGSVWLVLGLQPLLEKTGWELNGNFVNDFLYSVFHIGLVEEIAKSIPFVIVFFAFRKQFNEPIDYLVYICISALGFSAAENVFYFESYGPGVISSRAILSTLSHMIDSSLVAYGILYFKFRIGRNKVLVISAALLIAAVSHGFYDFWLIYSGAEGYGFIVTIFFFLLTISVFSTVLNNALNHSSMFSYKKVISPGKVAGRVFKLYGLLYLIQILVLAYYEDLVYAVAHFTANVYISGFILIISTVRLSRFKLIHNRWNPVRLELPFYYNGSIMIKGDGEADAEVNRFYEARFYLCPLTPRTSNMPGPIPAYLERKVFLLNDETFYLARLYSAADPEKYELILLKAKNYSTSMVADKYPIVAILSHEEHSSYDNVEFGFDDFEFQEWAYMKPFEDVESNAA